jgi:hypothetical protein
MFASPITAPDCRQRYLQLLINQRVTTNETLGRLHHRLDRHKVYRRLDEHLRKLYFDQYQGLLRQYGRVPLTAEE